MRLVAITHRSSAEEHAQLDDLLLETFGFSLAGWRQRSHWTTDYTCYALFEGERALANAGVYRMEMLVRGQKQVWLQLGAVATRKDRRGEGLSRRILEEVFALYPATPFFLFANESVVDFYPRFGFRRLPDRQPRCWLDTPPGEVKRQVRRDIRALSIDDPLIEPYLRERDCFSALLDCANAAPLIWFHLLNEYADCIYEIPALQTLLVARQRGEILTLVDVIARRPLSFADLAPCLDFPGAREIRFGFNPDWLCVDYEMVETQEEDATPIFARGDLTLPEDGDWLIPWMIRT